MDYRVLLSHILRGSRSLLTEILSRSTKMPVIQITDKTLIKANNSIDHFLFSLAKDSDHGSIGIILSPKEIALQLASISWCDKNILKIPLKVLWTKTPTKSAL